LARHTTLLKSGEAKKGALSQRPRDRGKARLITTEQVKRARGAGKLGDEPVTNVTSGSTEKRRIITKTKKETKKNMEY